MNKTKLKAFVKSLESAGMAAKGAHTNSKVLDTIDAIVSMSDKEFDSYIKKNPNRNVLLIRSEYSDWKETN